MSTYISHAEEVRMAVAERVQGALAAMGDTAVAAIRDQMEHGYDRPIRDTGALIADVCRKDTADPSVIAVGSTLAYAAPVHDGTSRMPGRPYLADGIAGCVEALASAAAAALSQDAD